MKEIERIKQEYDRQKKMLKNIYDTPQFAPQFFCPSGFVLPKARI